MYVLEKDFLEIPQSLDYFFTYYTNLEKAQNKKEIIQQNEKIIC